MLKVVCFEVSGRVQGVFFRKYTKKTCDKYAVSGWVLNTNHGSVQGMLEGTETALNNVKHWLQNVGSPKSRIDRCSFFDEKKIESKSFSKFSIIRDEEQVRRKTFKT